MSETILVVEDEPALRDTLTYNLKKDGFSVEAVGDGRAALDSARKLRPDLIVLDLMLPEIDGFEVCRILRREMSTPILMLTARDDEIDRVVGLEVGADDYLTKPFSMRELMARIKAQLRRSRLLREELGRSIESHSIHEKLIFGNLIINLTRREVTFRANSFWSGCGAGTSSATAGRWMSMYAGCGRKSSRMPEIRSGLSPYAVAAIGLKDKADDF